MINNVKMNSYFKIGKKPFTQFTSDELIRNREIIDASREDLVKRKRLEKAMRNFPDVDSNIEPYLVEQTQQQFSIEKFHELKQYFEKVNQQEYESEFLSNSTGVAKESIRSKLFNLNFEKFEIRKKEIYEYHPELEKYDFEKKMRDLTDVNDRIEFICDNYYLNYESDFFNFYEIEVSYHDGSREVVLQKRTPENTSKMKNFIDNFYKEKEVEFKFKLKKKEKSEDGKVTTNKTNYKDKKQTSNKNEKKDEVEFIKDLLRRRDEDEEEFEDEQGAKDMLRLKEIYPMKPFYKQVQRLDYEKVVDTYFTDPADKEFCEDDDVLDLWEFVDTLSGKDLCLIFSIEDLQLIVSTPYISLDYYRAMLMDKFREDEFKVAKMRAYGKSLKMKRYNPMTDPSQQINKEVIASTRVNFDTTKMIYDITFQKQFQENCNSYCKTSDNFRIDAGVILTRLPIFISLDDKEVKYMHYKKKFKETYEINLENYMKDLDVFNKTHDNEFLNKINKYNENNKENIPNIRIKKNTDRNIFNEQPYVENQQQALEKGYFNTYLLKENQVDDPYNFYSTTSKNYLRVDPRINDDKNIQTNGCFDIYFIAKNKKNGNWEFPTIPLDNGNQFRDQIEYLFLLMSQDSFSTYVPGNPSLVHLNREFFDYEN